MQQRRPVAGRPSGTDGSDFSYRMVVDSRYTKVAKGKSHLGFLLVFQSFNFLIGSILLTLFISKENKLDNIDIFAISTGFLSVFVGEIGRRRSLVVMLRLHTILSSMSAALSISCIARRPMLSESIKSLNFSGVPYYELLEFGRVIFGLLLQVVIVFTTVNLLQNMSPKRVS